MSEIHDGVLDVGGRRYMPDARGALVPEELVKPADKLIDQTVRLIMGHALDLNQRIARFKGHTLDDVHELVATIAEQYGTAKGGAKGNIQLTTYDGLFRVTVQRQDNLTFGPELQVAKALVDECIAGWAEGADAKIRALVEHAFQVDRENRINRGALFALRRLDIEDEAWKQAMAALTDSMRVAGTATYIRFHMRASAQAKWEPVTIDLANATAPDCARSAEDDDEIKIGGTG